jgi:hypothetical protein
MAQFEAEIMVVINYLESAFGNQLSESQMDAYVSAFQRLNIVKLRAAAEKIVKENLYFPKIAELHKAVNLVPDRFLNQGLMLDHQRKIKLLKDKFYRTREIDWSGFDALFQELRESGYWDKAEYLLTVSKRFEEILKREENEKGAKKEVVYKSLEELKKLYPEFVE